MHVNKYYVLGEKIGCGSFGEVFCAMHIGNGNRVAIKKERGGVKYSHLLTEARILKYLDGGFNIPKMHWYGREGDATWLIMDLYGPSLESLFHEHKRKLSLKTVLMLAVKILGQIEELHSHGIIHRDIKPDNFLMSLDLESDIFMIDFGLAKFYKNVETGQHIQYRDKKKLTGTSRYMSLSTHLGIEQSRRDDLESFIYMLIYLYRGSLPWQGLNIDNKNQRNEEIKNRKMSLSIETICDGCPEEFCTCLKYCRMLGYEDDPDYTYLRNQLMNLFQRLKYVWDDRYEWSTK